jgi:YVTN family beta-propeller protein
MATLPSNQLLRTLLRHQMIGSSTPMDTFRVLRHVWLMLLLAPMPAWAGIVRVYVTNSAGDSIHVIDPATNNVVQQIKGIEGAHGIAFSPDGSRVYVSDEVDSTLDVFDRKTGKLLKKVALSGPTPTISLWLRTAVLSSASPAIQARSISLIQLA